MKSAIDWDLVSRARRTQEKIARYFNLLDEVRALEADPEVASFLGAGEPTAASRQRAAPVKAALPPGPAAPAHTANLAVHLTPERGDGRRLFRVAREMEGDFNAEELLAIVTVRNPHLARRMPLKNANDHLRRLAAAGDLEVTQPGKRGKKGSLPRYRMPQRVQPPETQGSESS